MTAERSLAFIGVHLPTLTTVSHGNIVWKSFVNLRNVLAAARQVAEAVDRMNSTNGDWTCLEENGRNLTSLLLASDALAAVLDKEI